MQRSHVRAHSQFCPQSLKGPAWALWTQPCPPFCWPEAPWSLPGQPRHSYSGPQAGDPIPPPGCRTWVWCWDPPPSEGWTKTVLALEVLKY
ncbi:hypothetical protein EI555_020071 [Monodon monoceros]|uniref:Uncharacterized protein n=1 Tax=Monodon monoceros TaxID=40151 RepID=A0A4U1FMZ9_MONMO|nr:hypothetical protein EI555_020071 [Monodon monoceros]